MTQRTGLLGALSRLFRPGDRERPRRPDARRRAARRRRRRSGAHGATATVEIDPPRADGLRITYAPDHDGDPDAGEIVWTWVPYTENDGRGKDRPVLVIGRQTDDRVYAVRLTSKSHDGDRDFLASAPGRGTRRAARRGSTSSSSTACTRTACGARHPLWTSSASCASRTRCTAATAGRVGD